jgi:hypothetical protein
MQVTNHTAESPEKAEQSNPGREKPPAAQGIICPAPHAAEAGLQAREAHMDPYPSQISRAQRLEYDPAYVQPQAETVSGFNAASTRSAGWAYF